MGQPLCVCFSCKHLSFSPQNPLKSFYLCWIKTQTSKQVTYGKEKERYFILFLCTQLQALDSLWFTHELHSTKPGSSISTTLFWVWKKGYPIGYPYAKFLLRRIFKNQTKNHWKRKEKKNDFFVLWNKDSVPGLGGSPRKKYRTDLGGGHHRKPRSFLKIV